jgi:hypothetical protein
LRKNIKEKKNVEIIKKHDSIFEEKGLKYIIIIIKVIIALIEYHACGYCHTSLLLLF